MKKRVLLGLSLLTVICFAISGCGEKTPEDAFVEVENWDEDDFEEAVSGLEEEYSGENATSGEENDTADVEEVVFEPSPEIINASLKEPVIQICEDIYDYNEKHTVDDVIAMYGDKYDFSSIDADLFDGNIWRLPRLDNPNYELYIQCDSSSEDHVRNGDKTIYQISVSGRNCEWLPGGIECGNGTEQYSEDKEYLYDYSNFVSDYLGKEGNVIEVESSMDLWPDQLAKRFDEDGADVVYRVIDGKEKGLPNANVYEVYVRINSGEFEYNPNAKYTFFEGQMIKDESEIDYSNYDYYLVNRYYFFEDTNTGKILSGGLSAYNQLIQVAK